MNNGARVVLCTPAEVERLNNEIMHLRLMLANLISPQLAQAATNPEVPKDLRVMIDCSIEEVRAIVAMLGPVKPTGAEPPMTTRCMKK